MKVGVPSEVKSQEYRVAITPAGINELARHGHEVIVESDAGLGSSIADDEFAAAGAKIASSPEFFKVVVPKTPAAAPVAEPTVAQLTQE